MLADEKISLLPSKFNDIYLLKGDYFSSYRQDIAVDAIFQNLSQLSWNVYRSISSNMSLLDSSYFGLALLVKVGSAVRSLKYDYLKG